MDPTVNLKEQLALAQDLTSDDYPNLDDVWRLAELVLTLNDWITKGGSLPKSWTNLHGGK